MYYIHITVPVNLGIAQGLRSGCVRIGTATCQSPTPQHLVCGRTSLTSSPAKDKKLKLNSSVDNTRLYVVLSEGVKDELDGCSTGQFV